MASQKAKMSSKENSSKTPKAKLGFLSKRWNATRRRTSASSVTKRVASQEFALSIMRRMTLSESLKYKLKRRIIILKVHHSHMQG